MYVERRMQLGAQKVCEREKKRQETYQVQNGDGEDGQLIAFVAATP
jgi:hypothetical protein